MKILLLLLISFVSCSKSYEGEGTGFGGKLKVSLTLEKDKITDIIVLNNQDTDYIADRIFPLLKERVLLANSPLIDSISGATYTSFAYKTAVAKALKKAGKDVPMITLDTSAPRTLELIQGEDLITDVVVIGGGPAGLMAAVQAKKQNVQVTLVEKLDLVGGNGMHAEVLYGIPNTKAQQEKGITDSEQQFYETLKSSNTKETDSRLKAHAYVAANVDTWLKENGIEMNYAVNTSDPMYRTVMKEDSPKGYAGQHIILGLEKKARELGVTILTGTQVYDIILSNNQAVGITVSQGSTNYNIRAKSIVIATGGFSANLDLVHTYNPTFNNIKFTSNSKGAIGDLIPTFNQLGIQLRNMDVLNVHPVVEKSTRMPGGGFNPITEFMLVNKDGKRFINEINTRDALSLAIADQEDSTVYFVFDQASRELWAVKSLEGIFKNKVIVADTPEELAKKMHIDTTTFTNTLATYNKAATGEMTDPFGRTSFLRPNIKAPYYALQIIPAFHMTRGGIVTDKDTQVLNTNNQIIKGLFGAGEVTDITSGAFTPAIGFGYLAGQKAAEFAKK